MMCSVSNAVLRSRHGDIITVEDDDGSIYSLPFSAEISQQFDIDPSEYVRTEEIVPNQSTQRVSLLESTNQSQGRGKKNWTRDETKCLIQLYKEEKEKMNGTTFKNDTVWAIIANRMNQHGFRNSWTQCKFKFNALKRKYTATKDNNAKSGAARMDFLYMDEFDELFERDHSIIPPSRAESRRSEPVLVSPQSSSRSRSPQPSSSRSGNNESDSEDELMRLERTRRRGRKTMAQIWLAELRENAKEREIRHNERKAERKLQHTQLINALSEATNAYKETMEKLINKFS